GLGARRTLSLTVERAPTGSGWDIYDPSEPIPLEGSVSRFSQYGLTRSSVSSPFSIESWSGSGLRGAGFWAGSTVSRRSSVPRWEAVSRVDSRLSSWLAWRPSGVVLIASVSPLERCQNGLGSGGPEVDSGP